MICFMKWNECQNQDAAVVQNSMFKIPNVPVLSESDKSRHSAINGLADFSELECVMKGYSSETNINNALGISKDVDYSDGVPEEEIEESLTGNAFLEIENRLRHCNSGYPFLISKTGTSIKLSKEIPSVKSLLYLFLLFATRLNMLNDRTHGEIDGTLLFEEVACEIARNYLGNRAEAIVFGTASEGEGNGFEAKVHALCTQLNDDGVFRVVAGREFIQKDDGLDVVVWKHFTDRRIGKLTGFGQCKTGTSWRDTLSKIQPDAFMRKWMTTAIVPIPVRMFFVSEAIHDAEWFNNANDAGILFDRSRLIDYCPELSTDICDRMAKWLKHASVKHGYSFLSTLLA